mgnify:CR=1 FL=1
MDKITESEYRELLLVAEERRSSKGRGRHFTDREKRMFVQAYMAKQIAYDECKRIFNVSPDSIRIWQRNFAAEDPLYWSSVYPEAAPTQGAPTQGASAAALLTQPTAKSNQYITPMSKKSVTPQEQPLPEDYQSLLEQNRILEEKLRMAEIMLHAKDVMIDEAEKTFNIAIRKKSGAKR